MASTNPHTIVLSDTPYVQQERVANNVAITPGSLVELSAGKVQLHSTQAGPAAPLFALENPFSSDNTTAAIDAAYGTVDTVRYIVGKPGDVVYTFLAPGGSVNDGDYLVSAGSLGALEAYAGGTALADHRIVAQALETVAASGARARIKAQIV